MTFSFLNSISISIFWNFKVRCLFRLPIDFIKFPSYLQDFLMIVQISGKCKECHCGYLEISKIQMLRIGHFWLFGQILYVDMKLSKIGHTMEIPTTLVIYLNTTSEYPSLFFSDIPHTVNYSLHFCTHVICSVDI